MPRVKNGVAHHARKKKIMEAAKGARGGRSKLYKAAKETVERGDAVRLPRPAQEEGASSARSGSRASTPRPACTA